MTSITFSNDKSTLITCAKDGKLAFWNAKDSFKCISISKHSKTETELNVVHYLQLASGPYLVIGGATGALSVYDINNGRTCY